MASVAEQEIVVLNSDGDYPKSYATLVIRNYIQGRKIQIPINQEKPIYINVTCHQPVEQKEYSLMSLDFDESESTAVKLNRQDKFVVYSNFVDKNKFTKLIFNFDAKTIVINVIDSKALTGSLFQETQANCNGKNGTSFDVTETTIFNLKTTLHVCYIFKCLTKEKNNTFAIYLPDKNYISYIILDPGKWSFSIAGNSGTWSVVSTKFTDMIQVAEPKAIYKTDDLIEQTTYCSRIHPTMMISKIPTPLYVSRIITPDKYKTIRPSFQVVEGKYYIYLKPTLGFMKTGNLSITINETGNLKVIKRRIENISIGSEATKVFSYVPPIVMEIDLGVKDIIDISTENIEELYLSIVSHKLFGIDSTIKWTQNISAPPSIESIIQQQLPNNKKLLRVEFIEKTQLSNRDFVKIEVDDVYAGPLSFIIPIETTNVLVALDDSIKLINKISIIQVDGARTINANITVVVLPEDIEISTPQTTSIVLSGNIVPETKLSLGAFASPFREIFVEKIYAKEATFDQLEQKEAPVIKRPIQKRISDYASAIDDFASFNVFISEDVKSKKPILAYTNPRNFSQDEILAILISTVQRMQSEVHNVQKKIEETKLISVSSGATAAIADSSSFSQNPGSGSKKRGVIISQTTRNTDDGSLSREELEAREREKERLETINYVRDQEAKNREESERRRVMAEESRVKAIQQGAQVTIVSNKKNSDILKRSIEREENKRGATINLPQATISPTVRH